VSSDGKFVLYQQTAVAESKILAGERLPLAFDRQGGFKATSSFRCCDAKALLDPERH
jgi:hypothetical protein